MICVPNPVAQNAAKELIRQWAKIKISVELVTEAADPSGKQPPHWDIVYRTVRMQEPLVDLWPFLAFEPEAGVDSLSHFPDWLRQELIGLEDANTWSAAVRALKRLHQHLWAEVHVLPLWEVDDFLVIRKNLRDFVPRPVGTYDNVVHWIRSPRYPLLDP